MEKALELGDWAGFPARRAEATASAASAAASASPTTSTPRPASPRERAEITVHPDGRVDVVIGTVSQGQGHETSFAQLVTEWLGVPIEQGADHHRRHRHRESRRRHAFRPRHAARQHRHLERVAARSSRKARASRRACSSASPSARSTLRRTAAFASRPGGSALGRRSFEVAAAARASSPICPTTCAARSRRFSDETDQRRELSVRLPRRAKSRSIPRLGTRARSSATPRSTTWAARSTR